MGLVVLLLNVWIDMNFIEILVKGVEKIVDELHCVMLIVALELNGIVEKSVPELKGG